MIITFVGYSKISTVGLKEKLTNLLTELIKTEDCVSFYCGGYGDFDNLCASVCKELTLNFKHIDIVYITPYLTLSQQEKIVYMLKMGIYTSVIYPPIENVHPRFSIVKRNEWMIDKADVIIAGVKYKTGNSFKFLNYAKRKGKRIINIFEI